MVTPSLKARFQELGVALIPLEGGARAFVSEVTGAAGEVTIVIGGALGTLRPAGSAFEGAGPLGAAVAPSAIVEVEVDARSHAYLADHRIAGTVVVPVAMALEWMLRGARACRPDLTVVAVRNLKVLRGIKLEAFDADGDRLAVHARQLSNGAHTQLSVELRGRNQALHYSSTIEMGLRQPTASGKKPAPAVEPWQGPIYDGHLLFHGPQFQVLRAIDGVSAAGLTCSLLGARALKWPDDQWCSDPALVDGGLQALLLWVRKALGGASLPMSIGEYRCYREGLIDGQVRCVLLRRELHESRAVCDLALLDAQGEVVAELLAVEAVLRPGETRSAAPGAPALA